MRLHFLKSDFGTWNVRWNSEMKFWYKDFGEWNFEMKFKIEILVTVWDCIFLKSDFGTWNVRWNFEMKFWDEI